MTASLQSAILNLLQPGHCLTMDELYEQSDLTRRQIANGAAGLITRGYVERVEIGCYQLTGEGHTARLAGTLLTSGPRTQLTGQRITKANSFRARLWRAMRAMKTFTVRDLIALASTGTWDGYDAAIRYIRPLKTAGYLLELPRRSAGTALTSPGYKQYLLIRDTGHRAPIVKAKARAVYDQNTQETFEFQVGGKS